jgi:hypothetical protein
MKKILQFSFIACIFILAASACKKKSTANTNTNTTNTQYIDVEIPYTKSKTITDAIPSLAFSMPIDLKDTFATKVDEYLTTYAPGVKKEDIVKITPMMMNTSIDNTNTQNLDFVDDSVKVYVDAYNGTNPRLVAYKYGILPGATSIDFTVVDTDVKDYFNNQFMQFSLKFNTKANQGMLANTTFITNIKFKITAKKP